MKFIDLNRQYEEYKDKIDAQIKDVISTSSFIMGKKIIELEEKLADYVGTDHAVSCSSGTDALLLALMAYNVHEGDEIITTPFTFIATAEVISFLKAKPVFVDIKSDTYNIDPAKISSSITEKTKGILAVDLFGQCADYDEINKIAKEKGLFVIEDAAQSFGAEYKGQKSCSLADIACTSFFPAKPLGCFGDGGMIFTNNSDLADKMRSLRVHGKGSHKYDHVRIGINARLDTLQAAVLLGKIDFFQEEVSARNIAAKYYSDNLKDAVKVPKILDHNLSVYAQYSVQTEKRDKLQTYLKEKGIPTAVHYPKPLHLQEAFKELGYRKGGFPVAEKISEKIISLPMHPFIKKEEQDEICERINNFCTK